MREVSEVEELARRVALVHKSLMFIMMMRIFIRMMMSRSRIRIETCRQESHLLKSFNNAG